MNITYKSWRWWVDFHLLPLIQRLNTHYLPIHVAPKLLTPSIHSLYEIILKDNYHNIVGKNREPLHFKIGSLTIRFYILNLLDELLKIVLPLSNLRLNILIHINFHTRTFENGSHKIELHKEQTMDLNEIIEELLNKMHRLDGKYDALMIHSVIMKIAYGK